MSRKVIKNWKVIANNLDCVTAFNMFKNRAVCGHLYDIVGLRLKNKTYQSGIVDIERELFTSQEVLSNEWEIMIPDDDMENILENMRQLYKDEHFTRLTYEKIDNMSISDLYHALIDVMSSLDDRNKYRIAKHIIENKLYKKQ